MTLEDPFWRGLSGRNSGGRFAPGRFCSFRWTLLEVWTLWRPHATEASSRLAQSELLMSGHQKGVTVVCSDFFQLPHFFRLSPICVSYTLPQKESGKRSLAKKRRQKWQKRQNKWPKSDHKWRRVIELLLPTSFCGTPWFLFSGMPSVVPLKLPTLSLQVPYPWQPTPP